jgi:hypothetical protein
VQILEVHKFRKFILRGVSLANHIIRQDEDKAKYLLCATRFDGQETEK